MIGTRTRLSAIGLDVDAHEFRAVQLIRSHRGIGALAWAVFPRQNPQAPGEPGARIPDADELRWAREVLGRRGFVGSLISVAPSTADCTSHVIELPPASSGAPLGQLARAEVARARKCAPTDFELGFWPLPAKGRTSETLAVACARSAIKEIMDRYQQGGFTPVGIDLMELAIRRGVTASADDTLNQSENEINASLHVGWTSSQAVLTLGDSVVYVRRIERGASAVWGHATERYKLTENAASEVLNAGQDKEREPGFEKVRKASWASLAGELAEELDVAIAYVSHAFRMAPLGRIILSGYGVGNPVLRDQLDRVVGIPLVYAAPMALVDSTGSGTGTGPDASAPAARLTAAYGLAARFDR